MTGRVRVATAAAVLLALGIASPARSADDVKLELVAKPVAMRIATSDAISERAITAMFDLMYDAPARSVFTNARLGSGLARARLVAAVADGKISGAEERLVISGSPLDDTDKAKLSAAKQTLVRMPVHAVASAVLLSGPNKINAGFRTEKVDPDLGFAVPGQPEDLDGPHPTVDASMLKLPWSSLASMYLSDGTPKSAFLDNDLLNLWGYTLSPDDGNYHKGDSLEYLVGVNEAPWFSPRYEPSATNLYMQTAVATMAPATWSALFGAAAPEPSEFFLAGNTATWRSRGVAGLVAHLGDPTGEARRTSGVPIAGTMAAAPLWALDEVHDAFPDSAGRQLKLWVAELTNGNGEWIAPTSASISAALGAGGEEPLYALTNKVPGAYPLAWIESVYLPTTGLGIDEVNAAAAFVRLLVTDGQRIVAEDQDGVLPAGVVASALAAVNKAVDSNCTAAGGEPVSAKESPYYPGAEAAPRLATLAAQQQCATKVVVAAAATTTTTTVAATTTTTAATTSTTTATTTATTRATTAQAPRTTPRTNATTKPAPATGTTAAPTTVASAAPTTVAPAAATSTVAAAVDSPGSTPSSSIATSPVRATLPLSLPAAGLGGFDRLLTMGMGGLLLLVVRRRILLVRQRPA